MAKIPITISISSRQYALSEHQISNLAEEFYGKLLTAANIEEESTTYFIEFTDRGIDPDVKMSYFELSTAFAMAIKSFLKVS